MFISEHYEAKAAEAAKKARWNARWSWFYGVMFVMNMVSGVAQLVGGRPAISFVLAALMVGVWLMNRSAVKSYERTAKTYEGLARFARG